MSGLHKSSGLAARWLSEQQIADVMNFSLEELKKDKVEMCRFREAIRQGRAKSEAEMRDALFKRARGDAYAYTKLMTRG